MLIQIAIESGEQIFEVDEYDDRLSDRQVAQLYDLY